MTEQRLEFELMRTPEEQAGIIEVVPRFYTLEDRLALALKYERYMHRNYYDGQYHALFIAFNDDREAKIVMCNNRAAKDMLLVPLREFDKLIAEGGERLG
jgi:hypothetical protein